MPKPTISYLKSLADRLCRERTLAIGHCEICGVSDGTLVPAHMISRRDLRFRFMKKNVACVCNECHQKCHASPAWGRQMWIQIRGLATVEWLERESRRAPGPLGETFLRDIIKELKGEQL